MDRRMLEQSRKSESEVDLLHAELHDLCQPLTALQCRLEMSRIPSSGDCLKEVIEDAMEETHRIFAVVERMRSRLALEEELSQEIPHSAAGKSGARAANQ